MNVKVEPPHKSLSLRSLADLLWSVWRRSLTRIVLTCLGVCALAFCIAFTSFYTKYSRIVDERIRRPIFNEPAQIYAGAERVEAGDTLTPAAVIAELRGAGYVSAAENTRSDIGVFSQHGVALQVSPGPASYHPNQSATLHFNNGQVETITDAKGQLMDSYELEPQLVTGFFDAQQRSKRRLLTYEEIPPLVTNAIVSIEDRRFFEHGGINYVRLLEGLLTPLVHHRRMQGGSTLTMQMARAFFLTNERSLRRKLAEMTIALVLEHRFTKEQILTIYVNQVSFGQHGSFAINGFGEASQVFFGKDLKSVTMPEAALLAGVVNGPTLFSPFQHPAAATRRRNLVLQAMFDNHVITQSQMIAAEAAPLKLAQPNTEAKNAPYYVDLVRNRLLSRYEESELTSSGMRIYTALDRQLQQAASEAIQAGIKQVDAAIIRRRTRRIREGQGKNASVRTEVAPGPMPQVALIALDPHTGEVLALAGGRDYSTSQLNHALAKRPTGSIFKPFVYAAAINTALTGDLAKAYTPITMLDATEGTFDFNGKPYAPRNFDPKDSVGQVTARQALAHSINTATIRLAEMVGYDKVAQLAQAAGINGVQPTPAMALGAYDATPLDMASAYTVFANGGVRLSPVFIRSVQARNGDSLQSEPPQKANVLDSRVAYVITDMLQAVLNGGTASAVGARFNSPAAGKTGSSHDAWFAGYTSNLLCIVWVGNDDYTDIKIEGARAAAPIWTEFMLRARKLPHYRDMEPFTPPSGVVRVQVDKASNLPANETCPDDYEVYFMDGTVPAATCEHPNGPTPNFFEKMFGIGKHPQLVLPPITQPVNPAASPNPVPQPSPPPIITDPNQPGTPAPEVKEKKRGFWKRIFGGKDKRKDEGKDLKPE
ncbi:MAG: PBP1A family penicillin-binding protein [Bryobacteraceae bacterium]